MGSNIITGPYRESSLAKVFERTKSMLDAEVSDFDYYQSSNESAAFIAAPVMRGRTLIGVIELQLNNSEIYKLLSDYTGLGETGETVVSSLRGERLIFMAPHVTTPTRRSDGRYRSKSCPNTMLCTRPPTVEQVPKQRS